MEKANKEPQTVLELLAALKRNGVPEEKYAEHVDDFLYGKAKERGIPLDGTFELTPLCNLDCKMCYVHLNKEQMAGAELMPVEEWMQLAEEAVEAGMKKATLTGGECLTYPGFDELYLHLHSLGVEVSILTNGVLLDEKRIAFFKAHPVEDIQVSLYGSSEEAYERVTGHRQFERVFRNIKLAKEAGLPVRLAVTPSRFMKDDVENIMRLLQANNLTMKLNQGLTTPRENTGRSGLSLDASLDDYVHFYKVQMELSGQKITPIDPSNLPVPGGKASQSAKKKGLLCNGGRSSFCVGFDGKMTICSTLCTPAPNPLEIGFDAAWQIIREAAENYPIPIECQGCKYEGCCAVCAAEHQMHGAEPGHASPVFCKRAMRFAAEGLYDLQQ